MSDIYEYLIPTGTFFLNTALQYNMNLCQNILITKHDVANLIKIITTNHLTRIIDKRFHKSKFGMILA